MAKDIAQEEADQGGPPPRRRLFPRWSNETVIALSAVLISLCALTVSVVEVRLMHQQQRAMVYPHLTLGVNYSAEGFSVYVKNTGNGLAMVRDIRIWQGDRYFAHWLELIDTLLPEGHTIGYDILRHNQFADQVLPPGETIELMGLPWNPETRRLETRMRELGYSICYCSVMDECFAIEAPSTRPMPSDCQRGIVQARSFED